ncbi:MAG TPA: TraB/GumN family protein [Puia sp.]|jgi:uncharacterized protein YbaP (TraB family)
MKKLAAIALLAGWMAPGRTQTPPPAHPLYPSLLWEISGNGLSKPSYLFGSMHVSNKMVFHLSDSFYTAIAACDMVSLEVDPKEWQPDMFRLEKARSTTAEYGSASDNDYLTEADFRLKNYQDALRSALREDPFVVNGLLYRTNASQANFQENTYLDLYIYQTARKLGKMATGVENYLQTERLSEESALASLKEKRSRRNFPEGESEISLLNKLQDAYRRGDLDLLDSLNEMLSSSRAFTEKFMYPRNGIQANAIDSIIRHRSLFVAVGAAHLPGSQGVIERLRKKGYTVRPVKMTDQDAHSRETIDKMHVPVEWRRVVTTDGFVECQLPGPWFPRGESLYNESWQYADMENGSFYMLTRVRTNGNLGGESSAAIKMKIDSLLYDNVPGKILQKKEIEQDGYPGFEILNKTRVGDLQRYRILITPFEVLFFKMSGNEEYVSGEVADQFFHSIRLKEPLYAWTEYTPSSGGFRAVFPQQPQVSKSVQDRLSTWHYEAATATGETYVLLKKNVRNAHFLEEDTLDLSLMEESLKGSVPLGKEISRKFGRLDGYDCLDLVFSRKDGGRLKARAVIRGTDYFLLIASAKDEKTGFANFFEGFHLLPYRYPSPVVYTDTIRRFSVSTPVSPHVERDLQALTSEGSMYSAVLQDRGSYSAAPYIQYASFRDDSTGESVQVAVSRLPLYFYRKDSLKFWENEMHWTRLAGEFILSKKEYFQNGDSLCGYRYTLLDTNTNRKIEGLAEVKGNTFFKVTAITDQLQPESSFIRDFFSSFTPIALPSDDPAAGRLSVFHSKSSLFFQQYFSPDSLTRKRTQEAADHIIPEMRDLPELEGIIARLDPHGKTYIEEKSRLILALGRIQRARSMDSLIGYLQRLYDQCGDTSAVQNAVIQSMAGIKKPAAYALLKDWLIRTTPVFETTGELQDLFHVIGEDSTLAGTLFPEILRLTSVEDYKMPVINLLSTLADSGHIRKEAYADYFTNLFVDARILLKKQQMADEKPAKEDEDPVYGSYDNYSLWSQETDPLRRVGSRSDNSRLTRYAALLIPFYDRSSVPRFFEQLLATKSARLRLQTTILLIRNGRTVPDSVLRSLAADDETRADLFTRLEKAGHRDLFPAAYKNQEAMARAALVYAARYEKPAVIQTVGKKWVSLPNVKGYAWFFRYKLKDEDAWMMAISGVQPEKTGEVNGNHTLVIMTNRKLADDSPEQQQFDRRLHQLLLSKRKSALRFFQASTVLR